ncbi:MAG: ABC transporter ATP-binding protein [Corynebacteriales bacterium]|nr:ABC transporter ATP-binding protein [Mycobacteriales bacterium]
MTSTITVHKLHKSYGSVRAVDDVSFEVAEGEFFGILGPNGAGKTTTLELIEGLREPDKGTIHTLGLTPWPRNKALLPRIGVQLQATSFFERLTAREQLQTWGSLYGTSKGRADEMLELVGLADKAGTRTEDLSGGQAQRLSLACSLIHDPELVFLDEPTAALDPQARRNLWDLLRTINKQGRTVILTTHYMDEAELLCDRVAIMDHGKILANDAPATLVRNLDARVHISLPHGTLPENLELPGIENTTDDGLTVTLTTAEPAPVLTILAEHHALAGIGVKGATLEDVFLELTGREYRA